MAQKLWTHALSIFHFLIASVSCFKATDDLGFISNVKVKPDIPNEELLNRWKAFLDYTIGPDWTSTSPLLPNTVSSGLDSNSKHLSLLVGEGVPFNLRAVVYPLICRVTYKQLGEYRNLPDIIHGDKTIEKDLLRTLPGNIFFMRIEDEGAQVRFYIRFLITYVSI